MENCIFCGIVNNTIPAHKIYETDQILAFLDINPLNEGHTLVVPKGHYETIFDMDEKLSGQIMQAGWKIANCLRKNFEPDGLNLIQSNYKAANQMIQHFHLHLVPRYEGDNLLFSNWKLIPADQNRLITIAEQLKQLL